MENYIDQVGERINDHGICLIGPITDKTFCHSAINEIVGHLESQPRIRGREIRLPKLTGLTRDEVKELRHNWIPYVGFGAPCEPPAYHLNHAWFIRQYPFVYQIFSSLLGSNDLRVSIDRYKAKLPGSGEREFCHWDSDPTKWQFGPDSLQLQGIFALTDITFFCVPKTNTGSFRDLFVKEYANRVKFGPITIINPKDDPWNLSGQEIEITVPAGHLVIWDEKMLHSSYPNKTKDVKFAFYITYHRNIECKQTDIDRIRSYLTGMAPTIQPSGKKFDYMPPAWIRFPRQMREYH